MTTVAQALEAWYSACAKAACPNRLEAVLVPVASCAGRVTAQSVWAARSSPPFDASAMDGIAVRAAATTGASELRPVRIPNGSYEVVDTGDPLPDGYDAVVMREHVIATPLGAEVRAEATAYQNVRSIGEDVVANELLLFEGHRLRAADIAACAAGGVTQLQVRREPVVAVLPTGDEVRPVGSSLGQGEFYDTNSIMLAAQAREIGCRAIVLPIVPDEPEAIGRAVAQGVGGCDLLIIIAGASAGRDDYTTAVIECLGVLAVKGVAVRPGHPVMLGVIDSTPVLGAPGYPVSAALSFEAFAAPLLARLEGSVHHGRPLARARLAGAVSSPADMDEWVRVRLGHVKGRLVAVALPRSAGALTSLVRADGVLLVPIGSVGLEAGDEVEIRLLKDPGELERTAVVMGSNDLALDLAASALRSGDRSLTLALWDMGAPAGLAALRDGVCHLVASTGLDPASDGYLERALPGWDLAAVRIGSRQQGLIVAAGNPLGLRGIDDLARGDVRYVNRQQGSGTRTLLERELDRLAVSKGSILGYQREEHSHLAVAAAVASGRCDAGLGLLAAARAFGLGFLPVTEEPCDLVVEAGLVDEPLLAPLWDLLASGEFQASVRALGGYDTAQTGERVL
jgi:putative molybdopterin biosynthesis protein